MKINRFRAFRSSNGQTENLAAQSVYAEIYLEMDNPSDVRHTALQLNYSTVSFDATGSNMNSVSLGTLTSADLSKVKIIELGDYSTANSWYFTLTFSGSSYVDEASAKAYSCVSRASPPISIPANRKGIAFGMHSTATATQSKLESVHPAYLYGGVEQIGEKNADGSLWTECTDFEGFSFQNGATTPAPYGCSLRMRKIEGKCIIRGSVMIKPGSGTTVIANLPEEYKPMHSAYKMAACQGARIARIAVYGTSDSNDANYGKLALEWARDLSDGALYTAAAIWVDCSIEYWINDIEEA